jgi:uncharacterized protein
MTADEFLAEAGSLLLENEARHNLILGIAGTVRDHPDLYPDARFWIVDGAAALRTPPFNLVLAQPRDDDALARLVEALRDEELPGVVGAVPEVELFATQWGRPFHVVFAQGVFELTEVIPPPRASGGYREATVDDLDLILEWWHAFSVEALHDSGEADRFRDLIAARVRSDDGGIALWEDGGRTVSMSGYGSPTPNGIRIGPVYTPPELRGRGYATSLVAEQSEGLLARGRRFCFLYTDLANPTSNAIYERIGYRRIADSKQLAFE